MNDFGFRRPPKDAGEKAGKGIDVSGLPTGPIALDPIRERDAVQRGEALGFTDRGQGEAPLQAGGGRRKRPPPPPTRPIFIRAPEELADWFEQYTEQRGHRAFWQSIADFRALIDGAGEKRK